MQPVRIASPASKAASSTTTWQTLQQQTALMLEFTCLYCQMHVSTKQCRSKGAYTYDADEGTETAQQHNHTQYAKHTCEVAAPSGCSTKNWKMQLCLLGSL
jgi:hypothetical protein